MHEVFAPAPERSHEALEVAEAERIVEDGLRFVGPVRAELISNVETLEAKIPHDDVILDDKTYSFHVLRNAWLAKIDRLDVLERELLEQKAELQTAARNLN
jgi:hypothetical protein